MKASKGVKCIAGCYRWLLSLRYQVTLKGTDLLSESSTATLFLPNHQAVVDPQILFAYLLKYTCAAPLVTEAYFRIPVVAQVLRLVHAVKVPDLEKSRRGVEVVSRLSEQVVESLRQGNNVLIYPAGQLMSHGYEYIGNKQGTWQVCSQLPPDTRVVGVRIRGLWGSMWSKARTGRTPDFLVTYLKGIFYMFVNGIFFMPRRRVTISFYDITSDVINHVPGGRKELNHYLEEFYNAEGEESVSFLRHGWWQKNRGI